MERIIDNLIIGSGPSALAAAMALRRRKKDFEVVDAGFDLNPSRAAKVAAMSRIEPAQWSKQNIAEIFPPPIASAAGVEQRLAFGSDFPYRRPAELSIVSENCKVDVSHGFGGFGNVWGAAVLPCADRDLSEWPVEIPAMRASYRNLSEYMKISGANDGLRAQFPMDVSSLGALEKNSQTERLLNFLDGKKAQLSAVGITAGRASVAVDSSGGDNSCRYCGHCLDGCAYGSIFNPRIEWEKLRGEGFAIHQPFYAVEFNEQANGVRVKTIHLENKSVVEFTAKRLFLGLGALASTRLIARSLKIFDRPITLLDSRYFFFPLLSLRKTGGESRFTLAELFLEILDPKISQHFIHFQIYGINDIFRNALRKMFPSFLRGMAASVEKRFYLAQGFLHSADSGHLVMQLSASSGNNDRVVIRGVENAATISAARRAQQLLRRELLPFGIIPPFFLKIVPLGRSFHVGGSFPMGGARNPFASDLMGRPAGLSRVHLIDASTFPTIPATTITYTVMANADRIVELAAGQLQDK